MRGDERIERFFNTSLSNPSPLKTCPIQFFFLLYTVFIKHLFSSTILSTSSLLILSIHPFHLSPQPHSNASSLSTSTFLSVHVSHPYRATGHTNVLTILFFK